MIVTHEMNFARAISNRIFYMDEGGIYEDGTPEQIFEHPQRENTRRFIEKLKVLELNITVSGDDLALSVLKAAASSMEYQWNEGAELQNHLRLMIKKT